MIARQYCHGLMRKITYYVKTSTAFYSSTQNGKTTIIKVNSPPEFFASVSAAVKESEDDAFNVHLEKREDGNGKNFADSYSVVTLLLWCTKGNFADWYSAVITVPWIAIGAEKCSFP